MSDVNGEHTYNDVLVPQSLAKLTKISKHLKNQGMSSIYQSFEDNDKEENLGR